MDSFDWRAGRISIPIRRAPGHAKDARLCCTRGAAEFFRFDQLDSNRRAASAAGLTTWLADPRANASRPEHRYRIALAGESWTSKPRSVRFGLAKGSTQATLQVLAEHLDAFDVPWLWLCNEHGNRLPNRSLCTKKPIHAA